MENIKKSVLSEEKIIEQIEEVFELLRPNFYMHGGNIEFVHYDKGKVYVKLEGNCEGCPASSYTVKLMIESKLKEEVPQVTEVIDVMDAEE